jgi:hypothetical protein
MTFSPFRSVAPLRWLTCSLVLTLCYGQWPVSGVAADPDRSAEFLEFIRGEATKLRANDRPPQTAAEWDDRRLQIRQQLAAALGGFPAERCPLEPRLLDTWKRDGYRLEKLLFQTFPGVWMTAHAYVPDAPGPHPAILSVHGHWKHAKQEPTIQSRCIGAAKLGFFVLAVDAFGAGERATGKALGEYHGEMSGATLFLSGRTLAGVQLYENMRAVDYLQSRPEVDPKKIGVTGASGGGNQTMYAGAYEERFAAAVPVCSVGNYQAYLGAACCMCEVVPGALRFTEEGELLGLTAPRGLMVVNVSKDGRQFSIREARKSLVGAQFVYDVLGQPDRLYHSTFRWHHDYHQPIREAMYGFMTQQLKGAGDGSPIAEPAHNTEDTDAVRCYPGTTRPDDWVTLPQFAAAESRAVLAKWSAPANRDAWDSRATALKGVLRDKVFGGFPAGTDVSAAAAMARGDAWTVTFSPEPGLTLVAQRQPAAEASAKTAILLNLEGLATAQKSPLAAALRKGGWNLVTVELRATGAGGVKGDLIGRAPDHNSAEWSLWVGRPLLGQWTYDVLRTLDVLHGESGQGAGPHPIVIGEGPAGLVALSVGALAGNQVSGVAAVNTLASYVTDVPYQGQRLGTLAPGILRDVGDVGHLAALALPTRVVIAGGVNGAGVALTSDALREAYAPASQRAAMYATPSGFTLLETTDSAAILDALK